MPNDTIKPDRSAGFTPLGGSDVRDEPCDECGVNTLALLKELEAAKQARNKAAMEERGKYIPKLTALTKERDALKKLVDDLMYRADLFSYVCWLEEKGQRERVPEADFLCLASDGVTCWGKRYADAVKVALEHDKQLHDYAEHQNVKPS